ncbi:MAG: dihydrodipicolinate reductase [Pseudomonadota bacterium]
MRRILVALIICLGTAAPALADFKKISDRDTFVSVIKDRSLNIALFGIKLRVSETGQIAGRAWGRDVRGDWQWSDDGYFCRNLYWGDEDVGPNCQKVEVRGDTVRFTSDRGTGRYADLRLR